MDAGPHGGRDTQREEDSSLYAVNMFYYLSTCLSLQKLLLGPRRQELSRKQEDQGSQGKSLRALSYPLAEVILKKKKSRRQYKQMLGTLLCHLRALCSLLSWGGKTQR